MWTRTCYGNSPGKEKFKTVFPLITKDFIKMMIGLGASVGVVLAIHYALSPTDYKKYEFVVDLYIYIR